MRQAGLLAANICIVYFDYLNVLVFLLFGVAFVGLNLALGSLLRPNRPSPEKAMPYECGEDPIGGSWVRFDMRFYTVALVYIIFAVEIAFLFPWAVVLKEAFQDPSIGTFAFLEGVLFIGILVLGLVYVWAKGDLDWVKHFERPEVPGVHRETDRLGGRLLD